MKSFSSRFSKFYSNLGLIAALLFPLLAYSLPPQAEADMLQQEIKSGIQERQFKGLQSKFQRVVELKVKLPESFEFHWGRVSYENGEIEDALLHLDRYISAQGRAGKFYEDALVLYAKSEKLLAAQHQAAAEREAQRQLQAREEEMDRQLPVPPRSDDGSFAEIWDVLESAPAYRRYANLVKRRSLVYEYDKDSIDADRDKYRSKEKYFYISGRSAIVNLENLTFMQSYDRQEKKWDSPNKYVHNYVCLFGCLIEMDADLRNNSPRYVMKDLSIKGSLFPLRVGQSMSLSFKEAEYSYDKNKAPEIRSYSYFYLIFEKIPARTLNKAFSGDAWVVVNKDGDKIGYYVDDVGLFFWYSKEIMNGIISGDLDDYTERRYSGGSNYISNRRITLGN